MPDQSVSAVCIITFTGMKMNAHWLASPGLASYPNKMITSACDPISREEKD